MLPTIDAYTPREMGVALLQRRRVNQKTTDYSVKSLKKDLSGGR